MKILRMLGLPKGYFTFKVEHTYAEFSLRESYAPKYLILLRDSHFSTSDFMTLCVEKEAISSRKCRKLERFMPIT